MGTRISTHIAWLPTSTEFLVKRQLKNFINLFVSSMNETYINSMVNDLKEAVVQAGSPNKLSRISSCSLITFQESIQVYQWLFKLILVVN
jgi:hypothetical protein